MLQKDDAWPKLLFDYHKAILPTWDFGIVLAWEQTGLMQVPK
jgi:hypothetical protein